MVLLVVLLLLVLLLLLFGARECACVPEKGVPVVDFVSGVVLFGHFSDEQNTCFFSFDYNEGGEG